ncbi:MAG: hypothetical protein JOY80_07750 [Candidatus Dormibacteraeota bacterium]|nr:hypothetical protein [Candidatus Dormibacteraeota bacterium]
MANRQPRIKAYSFGTIRIDGVTYDRDVVIDRGSVRRRRKKRSKQFREQYGHTPLSVEEDIPWDCTRLIVGTGALGALPIMPEVTQEAERRGVELLLAPTKEAIELLREQRDHTNAVLHLTC